MERKTVVFLPRRLRELLQEETVALNASAIQIILVAILECYGIDLIGELRTRRRYYRRRLKRVSVPASLREYAEREGMSLSMFVKKALVEYFRRRGRLGKDEFPNL